MWIPLLLLVSIIPTTQTQRRNPDRVQSGAALQLMDIIDRCCILGTRWHQRGSCDSYPQPISTVPQAQRMNCLAAVKICCLKKKQESDCVIGKSVAQRTQNCDAFTDKDSDEQKECCNCCKLGIVARGAGMSCNATSLGPPCDGIFYDCCSTKNERVSIVNPATSICSRYRARLCSHTCLDTPGPSFKCACPAGMQLDSTNRHCRHKTVPQTGVNIVKTGTAKPRSRLSACATNNPCEHTCVDTGVEIRCTCRPGYNLNRNGRTCDRKTSVSTSTQTCPTGYEFHAQRRACIDINECARNPCAAGQTCSNNQGSYVCRREMHCGTGYTLDEDTQGCEDIDECADDTLNNCGQGVFECINTRGSFRCAYKKCPAGSRLDGRTGQCVSQGCQAGLTRDSAGQCIDINECENSRACPTNSRCVNTRGSYNCIKNPAVNICGQGLRPDDNGICVDIDECTEGSHSCPSGQSCINRPRGYLCRCQDGFEYKAIKKTCDDVNECTRFGQVCSANSQCRNTQGSFLCDCKDGFKSIKGGRGSACQDVDECASRSSTCAHNCHNTWGSYQCTCREGYQLADDKRSCTDVDECSQANNRWRPCVGICQNTHGSFKCSCPSGYQLMPSGRVCQDVDECGLGTANCNGPNQMCVNVRGGFRCKDIKCPSNFMRSVGFSRKYIRCTRASFVCDKANDPECKTLSYSYNFITFPGKLVRTPARLFKMLGPSGNKLLFELEVESANPLKQGVTAAQRSAFELKNVNANEVFVSMITALDGPQDVVLKLKMHVHKEGIFFGTAIARIFLYITGNDF